MIPKKKAKVVTVGTARFPRYIIVAESDSPPEQRWYWAGQTWIAHARRALLYADRNVALQDLVAVSAGEASREPLDDEGHGDSTSGHS